MLLLIKMALRNLTRHRRRVVAIAIILALGITTYLTIDSLMLGLTKMSFNNLINLETGHLQIVNQKYWKEKENLSLNNLIDWNENLVKIIKQLPDYQALSPQLKFSANLNNGTDELPVVGYGINPEQARKVFTIENYLVEGSYFSGGGYEAILGKKLANLMELKLGDYITLLVKTETGTFNTIDAEIIGLLSTQNPDVNSNFVYLPLKTAQQALNTRGKVSQIIVRLDNQAKVKNTTTLLNKKLAAKNNRLVAYSWRDLAETVIAMNKAQNFETGIMMSIILIIAAIGIINTVVLSSLERIKEIGMMKALGFKKKEIVFIFMIESAGIGVIGGLIGLFLSSLGVYYLVTVGIDLTTLLGGQTFGIPVLGRIYGIWSPLHFIFIFVAGTMLASLASIPPAYWAAKKDPVEALKK